MTGSESWQQSGRDEHAQGEAEYKAAQAKGYAEGTMDRLGGKKDAVVGAVTGDREQEVSGMLLTYLPCWMSYMLTSWLQETFVMTRVKLSRTSTIQLSRATLASRLIRS